MYDTLRGLLAYYHQDYEIYKSDTEPLDAYCYQHDINTQKKLVIEIKKFLNEVEMGSKGEDDLVVMGIEYLPDSSFIWLRNALAYLEKKIAMN